MPKPKNRYDVYENEKLYMHNVTIDDFSNATGISRASICDAIAHNRNLRYKYRFQVIECKTISSDFAERWREAVRRFEGFDFSQHNGIRLVPKEASKG